jgi:very-short-patch-repair endonuclease
MAELPRDFRAQAYALVDPMIDYWQSELAEICESPIEVAFAVAFTLTGWQEQGRVAFGADDAWENAVHGPDVRFILRAQKQIDTYRADFVAYAFGNRLSSVIVECDGHDFHERTKEQAERDRSRDRALQGMGFPVFRFTGSEIYRNAFACAGDVFKHVNTRDRETRAK